MALKAGSTKLSRNRFRPRGFPRRTLKLPKGPAMTMSMKDPGFSRDPELEKTRGLGRPAASEMSGEDHSDDPAPDRHIHFSPDPAEETTAPTPTSV
ncbi:hypothetical protein [Brevundimonas kwangchunensis]